MKPKEIDEDEIEEEVVKKKQKFFKIFLIIVVSLVIIGSVVIFPQKTITCCESKQEIYYETVNANNCDRVAGCGCLHTSWLGLGVCDSCSCRKTRNVNIPFTQDVNWLIGSCE